MGESDGAWGTLAKTSDELAELWDSFDRLPPPGNNEALDAFCDRKHITLDSLLRLGTRITGGKVLCFAYPGGIKYRDIITNKRWNYYGSEFSQLNIVPAGSQPTESVIVCEGETDGAWLSRAYEVDVAILPAGALRFTERFAEQLSSYEQVLVALDNDSTGDKGAQKIIGKLPQAIRFRPPNGANDWCALTIEDAPELPSYVPEPESPVVFLGELFTLEAPEIPSWYEHDILPIGGLLLLHGAYKSFKSFIGLDLMANLAMGEPWCAFEPTEEPARVAVIQFEIAWPYYKSRMQFIAKSAGRNLPLLLSNFGTYSPLVRPKLTAGNTKEEDKLLTNLVENDVNIVLLDPIRRAVGEADINAENEIRKMLSFFQRLQDEGITVVATHHDNKEGDKHGGGDPSYMTGSGALAGDPDTIVSVSRVSGDGRDSARRNLSFTLRNSPPIGRRGVRITDDGGIEYQSEAWDYEESDEVDETTEPAI